MAFDVGRHLNFTVHLSCEAYTFLFEWFCFALFVLLLQLVNCIPFRCHVHSVSRMANQASPTPARPLGPLRRDSWNELPGFGLPLTDMPRKWKDNGNGRTRFPNAISDWAAEGVTVRERTMLEFINLITDKPDWGRKIFDEGIVQKWRLESAAHGADFSEKMFDFVSIYGTAGSKVVVPSIIPLPMS